MTDDETTIELVRDVMAELGAGRLTSNEAWAALCILLDPRAAALSKGTERTRREAAHAAG